MNKAALKKIIPDRFWKFIRLRIILADHSRIAKLCRGYIDDYFSGRCAKFRPVAKKDLGTRRVIWQYWAQGFEPERLPDVVKLCLDSVDRWRGDYEIIRLSDATISEYVDLPDFVWAKKEHGFSTTSFSNILRLALLAAYGGCWLDSTVYLSGPIPERYSDYGFFMFQRDDGEVNKSYWENTYAYYFGWDRRFKVRVLTSIAFAKAGDSFTTDYLNLMLQVWERNDHYPFYFIFQIMFNELVASGHSRPDCPLENDCPPHYLMQIVNDSFPYASVKETMGLVPFHKLTFKNMEFRKLQDTLGI